MENKNKFHLIGALLILSAVLVQGNESTLLAIGAVVVYALGALEGAKK